MPAHASQQPALALSELEHRQVALAEHQQTMRACTACVAAGFIDAAWPVFRGHARHRILVVGQAPAVRRDELPLPYSGASGQQLRRWLSRAGFPDDALHQHCYLTSLTKCFPGSSPGGKGDRAPSAREVALCRPNLERELALVRPEVILALGRLAAVRFAENRPLAELVGHVFEHDGAAVIPLPHPSGVSRWLNDPANQALLDRALAALSRLREQLSL